MGPRDRMGLRNRDGAGSGLCDEEAGSGPSLVSLKGLMLGCGLV